MAEAAATLSAVKRMGGALSIIDGGDGGNAVSGDKGGRRTEYGRWLRLRCYRGNENGRLAE